MERRNFFRTLLGGSAALVVAPSILATSEPVVVAEPTVVDTSLLPSEWGVEKVMAYWREMGIMPINNFKETHWKSFRRIGTINHYDNNGKIIEHGISKMDR